MVKCLNPCCCPEHGREGLALPNCRFAAGVYQNVNIEIGQNCQIIRITPADKTKVLLCDPCKNVEQTQGGIVQPADNVLARNDNLTVVQGQQSNRNLLYNDDLTTLYQFNIGTLPTGVSIDGSGFIHVENTASVGTYTIPYTLTNNANGQTSSATITLTIEQGQHSEVKAMDDVLTAVIGGNSDSVLLNDSLSGGVTPSATDVTLTALTAPSGLTLNADGTISVANTVTAGTYTFDYQLCDNNGDCAVASVTLTVTAPAPTIQVSDKTFTLAQGATSTAIIQGDTLPDGSSPTAQNSFVTATHVPPELSYDNSNHTVTVNSTATAGTYTFDYQLCDQAGGDCESATITVIVP